MINDPNLWDADLLVHPVRFDCCPSLFGVMQAVD